MKLQARYLLAMLICKIDELTNSSVQFLTRFYQS